MANDQTTTALVNISEALLKSKGVIEYLEQKNEELRLEIAIIKMKPIIVED